MQHGKAIREAMKINEVVFDSGVVADPASNGNGHSHPAPQQDDFYQAAYDEGLAHGREAGYRQGYQAGFADGFKQAQGDSGQSTTAGAAAKTPDGRLKRLRGLPCAHCGASVYSDETSCRCCGTPKGERVMRNEQPS